MNKRIKKKKQKQQVAIKEKRYEAFGNWLIDYYINQIKWRNEEYDRRVELYRRARENANRALELHCKRLIVDSNDPNHCTNNFDIKQGI